MRIILIAAGRHRSLRVLVPLTSGEVRAHIVDNVALRCCTLLVRKTNYDPSRFCGSFHFRQSLRTPAAKHTECRIYILTKLLRATLKRRERVRNVLATDKSNRRLTINISLQPSDIPTASCKMNVSGRRNKILYDSIKKGIRLIPCLTN